MTIWFTEVSELSNYCTEHQTSFADIEVEHKNEEREVVENSLPDIR
ncbi:hypothetical protein [Candidatus Minimicrobia vallesae]